MGERARAAGTTRRHDRVKPVAPPAYRPEKILNARCPRWHCGGDVYHDRRTNRVFCPKCEAAKADDIERGTPREGGGR